VSFYRYIQVRFAKAVLISVEQAVSTVWQLRHRRRPIAPENVSSRDSLLITQEICASVKCQRVANINYKW